MEINKPTSGKMAAHCLRLAQAISVATSEHGRPNSFSANELSHVYGAPNRMLIGRIGNDYGCRLALHSFLVTRFNWKGTAPQYGEGRFYV